MGACVSPRVLGLVLVVVSNVLLGCQDLHPQVTTPAPKYVDCSFLLCNLQYVGPYQNLKTCDLHMKVCVPVPQSTELPPRQLLLCRGIKDEWHSNATSQFAGKL